MCGVEAADLETGEEDRVGAIEPVKTPQNKDETRLYVIGDIHGRLDLLEQLVQKIEHDLQHYPTPECVTITLGDYIDRGPDSRGVLDCLSRNPFPTRYVPLKGNHEELLELFLAEPSFFPNWRRLGGLETLHSYGISISSPHDGERL